MTIHEMLENGVREVFGNEAEVIDNKEFDMTVSMAECLNCQGSGEVTGDGYPAELDICPVCKGLGQVTEVG